MTKHKTRKPSQSDVLRLGSEIANIKAQTDPKSWAKFVKATHAKGFTVAGGLSGNPDPLKERLQSSLKTQAQSEINDAYKPALDDLTAQDSRITAWDDKRRIDNQAYTNWLMNANAQLNHNSDAAIAAVRNAGTPAVADFGAASHASQGAVAAQPGTVSDMSQSTALNYAAPAARDQALAASSGSSNTSTANALQSSQDLTKDNVALASMAHQAQNDGATTAQRNDLIDQRSKLNIQRASDYLSAFTKLQDNELTKAQSNRDYGTATAALNLKTQTAADTLSLNKAKLSEKTTNDKQHVQLLKDNKKISAGRLALEQGKADLDGDGKITKKDYQLKKQIDAKYGSTKTPKADPNLLTGKNRAVAIQGTQKAKSRLAALRADLKAGKKHKRTIRQILESEGYAPDQINVAEMLSTPGGSNTPAYRAALKRLGLSPGDLG